MSKYSLIILFIAIVIGIYYKKNDIKAIISSLYMKDISKEEQKKYILTEKNTTMEDEFIKKYNILKEELINYLNNNTYLAYERQTIDKIKDLEKEKYLFEELENNLTEMQKIKFDEKEIQNLTELIDRYILSDN